MMFTYQNKKVYELEKDNALFIRYILRLIYKYVCI
jgi:hypothetical protein